MTEQNHEIQPL